MDRTENVSSFHNKKTKLFQPDKISRFRSEQFQKCDNVTIKVIEDVDTVP